MRKAPTETIKSLLGLVSVGVWWTGVWLGLQFWSALWPIKHFSSAAMYIGLIIVLSWFHSYVNSWINPRVEKLKSLHDDQ